MPKLSERFRVLLLSGSAPESPGALEQILARHVELVTATSLAEMLSLLGREEREMGSVKRWASKPWLSAEHVPSAGYDAFLCDWSFADGTWRSALEQVQQRAPDLPTIVVCRCGGEREWVQVLEAGAFDMLGAPFSEMEVLSVLEHAVALGGTRALRGVA